MRKRYEKKNNSWENLSGFRYAHRGLFHQPLSASRKILLPAAHNMLHEKKHAMPVRASLREESREESPALMQELPWKKDAAQWKSEGKRIIPENSLAAFELAVRKGFGSELDVHLSADGRLCVFHDDSLRRMTGAGGRIEDLTWPEISGLRLLDTKHGIPLLEDVLKLYTSDQALAPGRHAAGLHLPLIIELKTAGNVSELCRRAMETIDRYPALNYCVESFDPRAVLWLRRNRPDVFRGQLTENFMKSREAVRQWGYLMTFGMWSVAPDILSRPDFIASRFRDRRNLFIRLSHRFGVRQVNWVIRSRKDMHTVDREGGLSIFERFLPDRE